MAALAGEDLSSIGILCDVGGGHGHLACRLLHTYPELHIIVFDLPEVIAETDQLWAPKLGLCERCRYIAGDMFVTIPTADAYTLKSILHDWSDGECIRILTNLRLAVSEPGRIYVADFVVPGPAAPHFAKLFDIHLTFI